MEVLPIDLTQLVGATLGISIVLIPVIGFTVRFAFKPLVEAIAVARGARARDAEVSLLEKRVELLERQVELLQRSALPAGGGEADALLLPERTRASGVR
jgi:hypothetical protein